MASQMEGKPNQHRKQKKTCNRWSPNAFQNAVAKKFALRPLLGPPPICLALSPRLHFGSFLVLFGFPGGTFWHPKLRQSLKKGRAEQNKYSTNTCGTGDQKKPESLQIHTKSRPFRRLFGALYRECGPGPDFHRFGIDL